jgi:hypothetical protein
MQIIGTNGNSTGFQRLFEAQPWGNPTWAGVGDFVSRSADGPGSPSTSLPPGATPPVATPGNPTPPGTDTGNVTAPSRICKRFKGKYKGVRASARKCTTGSWTPALTRATKAKAKAAARAKWKMQRKS